MTTARAGATGPSRYEIRLGGRLDSHWSAWFDGMSVATDGDGTTVLRGPLADQSALHGVLRRVHDLGLSLVSVVRLDVYPSPSPTHQETDMTTTVAHVPPPSDTTDPLRRRAFVAGALYLLTFVSMPTLALYGPVRDHADLVLGSGSTIGLLWGALSEVVVALAGIGTAVVLYPVARRQSETAALGFVASRVLEAALILVGVVNLLSIVTLRDDLAGGGGADPGALLTTTHALVAGYDRAFLVSQSLAPVLNALCLGYVLYRSGLVPRVLPVVGLVGAPLLLASDVAIFFGVYDRMAPIAAFAALPIAVWEFSLGCYLLVKGFRPAAVAALR